MKKLIKILACVLCTFALLSVAACGGNNDNKSPVKNTLTKQLEVAEKTYKGLSDKQDGLFTYGDAQALSALAAPIAANEPIAAEGVTLETVRKIADKYRKSGTSNKRLLETYVCDIFVYSQTQSAIISERKEESLVCNYALDYSSTNWDTAEVDAINLNWTRGAVLKTAAFVGADLDTGRVYCEQTHKSGAMDVEAKVEYFYNSDSDLGVTTLNWRYNSSGSLTEFEYHFLDMATATVYYAKGSFDAAKNIVGLNVFLHMAGNSASTLDSDENATVREFIESEIERISNKVDELRKENLKATTDAADETENASKAAKSADESTVLTCKVTLDFSVLKNMLGQGKTAQSA